MKNQPPSSCPITPLPEYIGPYKILRKIASGGMGEVFLAQDPFCKRNLALKRIRSDKIDHPGLKERFLKEVQIAAQLSHPSIIPIYQLHQDDDDIYYTMPLVEGNTLKEILKDTLHKEKNSLPPNPIGSSTPSLMRIFLSICQAIAYSHSKGILHRDIKPENIIIGLYGEVLILDWGLADFVSNCEKEPPCKEEPEEEGNSDLTKPGKIAGTLSYLPPERIFGKKASFTSDIYALGVILYQLLTLRFPFHRKSIKHYKQQIKHEALIEPQERAPYRDIPPQLSKIAKKCLANRPQKRYGQVEEILIDLNNYIEGHAEWTPYSSVQVERKSDWKFQENILLAKHLALTQKSDIMEWVSLMIAEDSFPGKIKLETHVRIKESGGGIGFLLDLKPSEEQVDFFQDGFFIWIGSEQNPGCHLFRSNVELMSNPELYLKNQLSHFIRIEKTDHHVRLYIDNILAFDYLSHIPFSGPLFGLILKDDDLDIGTILVSSSSPNRQVSCLAVPDALLALNHFKEAYTRYRQIASSFAGRTEGKEALFRAGITLLEEAQHKKEKKNKEALFEQALQEFDKFRNDSGSPLEYLGKSLVYKATKEQEEELKCLELALRKFEKHPLVHLVKEQILFRLHEASYKDKAAAYALALLALRLIPEVFSKQDNKKLLLHLQKNCEDPGFLVKTPSDNRSTLTLQLAFWLFKPFIIMEIFHNAPTTAEKINALYALFYLGHHTSAIELLSSSQELLDSLIFQPILDFYKEGFEKTASLHFDTEEKRSSFENKRAFNFLLTQFYFSPSEQQISMVKSIELLCQGILSFEERLHYEKNWIEFLLYLHEIEAATARLDSIPEVLKEQESSPFYFLYGCVLASKEGFDAAKEFLCSSTEKIIPETGYAIDYFLSAKSDLKKRWLKKAFFQEKIRLFRQLSLLYRSAGLERKYKIVQRRIDKEFEKNKP